MARRDIEGLPPGHGSVAAELGEWYEAANAYYDFVFRWRTNYVKVDVDNPATLDALRRRCGVRNYSFGVHNMGRYNHTT